MTDKSKEFLKRSIEELRLIKIDKIASQTDSKIHEEDSILDVVEELIINSREVLPVIKNNELIGIIRKNKIATKIEKNKDYEKIKAKEIMETNFISCSLKDSLNKILEEAIKNNSDTIVIFKKNKELIKILDYFDIIELFTNTKFIIENPPILRDCMDTTVIITPPKTNLLNLKELFLKNNSNYSIILEEGTIKGIATLKDLINQIPKDIDLEKTFAQTIMSPRIISMHPGDSLNEAFKIFKEKRFNQIPLIAEGKLVGILKINDAIKTYYQFLLNIKNPKNDFDIQEI